MFGFSTIETLAPLALLLGMLILFGGVRYSRTGIIATLGATMLYYLHWRISQTIPWSGSLAQLWWPLTCLFVEVAALFDATILLAILSRPTDRSGEADAGEALLRTRWDNGAENLPAVDVFIATYNEPRDVLEKTILGCLALNWPDARVWVLDDGRRQWVRDLCVAKGAGYINRPDNKGAKAGNINHALTLTTAPYVAVFDADFIPRRDFLLRTMGFFEDEKIGIVQIPHSFYNHDPMQTNLGLQHVMPDDQRFFFEAIMPGRDGWDTSFCCGSNSVTRRKLFEDIGGGLPEGSITEDMLLTLASLRQGYVTRYLNEPLAYGLAPESTAAFFVQRQRWAQGAIQIFYLKEGPLGPGLKLRHRLMFLPSAWITQGLQSAFAILMPILFMLFNLSPMVNVDLAGLVQYLLPLVVSLLAGITLLAPGRYFPLAAQVLAVFQMFRILPVVLQTLVRPRGHVFKVTPKGSAAGGANWESRVLLSCLFLIAASVAGMIANISADHRIVAQDELLPMVGFWLLLNMLVMLLVAMMCLERPRVRGEERFEIEQPLSLLSDTGHLITSGRGDISLSGLGMEVAEPAALTIGERVQIVLPEVGIVRGFIRRTGRRIGVAFDFHSEDVRDRLIVWLFTNRIKVNAQRPSALAVAGAVIRRLWAADLTVHAFPAPVDDVAEPQIKLSAATRLIEPSIRKLGSAHGGTDAADASGSAGGAQVAEFKRAANSQ